MLAFWVCSCGRFFLFYTFGSEVQKNQGSEVLIFLDLETTGLEAQDRICAIGLIALQDKTVTTMYDIVNEGKKISAKASSINHITNEMLKAKPTLKESKTYQFLQLHNNENSTIVAHNVKFDLEKLSACGFEFQGQIIDTLRVTKHLLPECEAFSLQFLRYDLKLYKDEKKEALACGIETGLFPHHALSDALFVKLLYECLSQMRTKEQMIALSAQKVLMQKLPFGKYAGKFIEDIAMNEGRYLHWMLDNITGLDEDLRYSIDYYLQG